MKIKWEIPDRPVSFREFMDRHALTLTVTRQKEVWFGNPYNKWLVNFQGVARILPGDRNEPPEYDKLTSGQGSSPTEALKHFLVIIRRETLSLPGGGSVVVPSDWIEEDFPELRDIPA